MINLTKKFRDAYLNEVPANLQLKEIAAISLGITLRGADASRHDPRGTHQLVRIGDLSEDGDLAIKEPNLLKLSAENIRRFSLKSGDVLLAARGSRMTACVHRAVFPAVAGGQFLVIRPQENRVNPEYLRWFLNLSTTQEAMATMARGSYMRSLPASAVGDLEIPLPPLERQRAIAELHALRLQEKELMVQLAGLRATHIDHALTRTLHA